MTLYRYQLTDSTADLCNNKSYRFDVVRYTVGNIAASNLTNVIYLSPSWFVSSPMTQEHLSLSYGPNYRFRLAHTPANAIFKDNLGKQIEGDVKSKMLHAWPAFGYAGGGREALLVCSDNSNFSFHLPSKMHRGGRLDVFRMDYAAILDPITLLSPISQAVVDSIQAPEYKGSEVIGGKYQNDIGVIIALKYRSGMISISVGFNIFENRGVLAMIWGTYWEDIPSQSSRSIWGPVFNYFFWNGITRPCEIPAIIALNTLGYRCLKMTVTEVLDSLRRKVSSPSPDRVMDLLP